MVFPFPKKKKKEDATNCTADNEMTLKIPYSQNIATYDLRPLFKNLTKISFSHSHWYMYEYINIYKKL